jgi:hypothetical protein
MVEVVAKAIAIEIAREMNAIYSRGGSVESSFTADGAARAALQALLTPTGKMVEVGIDKLEECTDNGYDSDMDGNRHEYTHILSDAPQLIFAAMIQAALNEHEVK